METNKKTALEEHIEKTRKIYVAIQDCKGLSFHKKDLKKYYRKLWNELKDYCYYRQISFKQICKDYYLKGV